MLLGVTLLLLVSATQAQCPASCSTSADCTVCGLDPAFGTIFSSADPRFWECDAGSCVITAEWVVDGEESSIAVLDVCAERVLPGTDTTASLCCYSDADNSGLTGATQIAFTDPFEICARKRCEEVTGCSAQGVCQYNGVASVVAACCTVNDNCPPYENIATSAPTDYQIACFKPSCIANSCDYSPTSDCCVDDSQCDGAPLGLAPCEGYFCNTSENRCERRTLEGCACSADAQCGSSSTNLCVEPKCNGGACTTEPRLFSGAPSNGCCASAGTALDDCNRNTECTSATSCRTSNVLAGGIAYSPTYQCVFAPASQTGCCTNGADCEALATMADCVSNLCDGSNDMCALNPFTAAREPCCYETDDCYTSCAAAGVCDANGVPSDRCVYYTCNGGTETAGPDTFKCAEIAISGCSPNQPLPTLTVTADSAAASCDWTCPGDADANTIGAIGTFSPIERPIYDYELRVVVTAQGGPQTVASVELNSLSLDPAPTFSLIAPSESTLTYVARFEPSNFAPIEPGQVLQVEAIVEFDFSAPVTQYAVTLTLEPRHQCTPHFYGVDGCALGNESSFVLEPSHSTPTRDFVFDGVACSVQCDESPVAQTTTTLSTTTSITGATPSPTPDPSSAAAELILAANACTFDCTASPLDRSINFYDIDVRRDVVSPFVPSIVLFVQFDPSLYHNRLGYWVPGLGETEDDARFFSEAPGLGFVAGLGVNRDLPFVQCSTTNNCDFVLRVPVAAELSAGEFTIIQIFENIECQQNLVERGACQSFQLGQILPSVALRQTVDFGALGCTTQPCPAIATEITLDPKPSTSQGTVKCDWQCGSGNTDENTVLIEDLCFVNPNDFELPLSDIIAFDGGSFSPVAQLLTPDAGLGSIALYAQDDPSERSVYLFEAEIAGFVNVFGGEQTSLETRPTIPANSEKCFVLEFQPLDDTFRGESLRFDISCSLPCNGLYTSDAICTDTTSIAQRVVVVGTSFASHSFGACPFTCERTPPVRLAGQLFGAVWIDDNCDDVRQITEAVVPGVVFDIYSATNATTIGFVSTDTSGAYQFSIPEEYFYDGVTFEVRVRTDTIPRGFDIITQTPSVLATFLRNAFSPTSGRSYRVFLEPPNYLFPQLNLAIKPTPPCTPFDGPYIDDGLVVSFGGVPSSCIEPVGCANCASAEWRTVRYTVDLQNFGSVAVAPSTIELRAQPLGAVSCLELGSDVSNTVSLVAAEPLVVDEAHIAYFYGTGVPADGSVTRITTLLSYCAPAPVQFNLTATIYGDHCVQLINDWTRCVPDVDPRECYAQTELNPGVLSCPATPTAAPTPEATPIPTPMPTPRAGSIAASPYDLHMAIDCEGASSCIDRKFISNSRCANTTLVEQRCTGSPERGIAVVQFSVTNRNASVATGEFTAQIEPVGAPMFCGTEDEFSALYQFNLLPSSANATVGVSRRGSTVSAFVGSLPPLGSFVLSLALPFCELPTLSAVGTIRASDCFDETCTTNVTLGVCELNGECDLDAEYVLFGAEEAGVDEELRSVNIGLLIAAMIAVLCAVVCGVFACVFCAGSEATPRSKRSLKRRYTQSSTGGDNRWMRRRIKIPK